MSLALSHEKNVSSERERGRPVVPFGIDLDCRGMPGSIAAVEDRNPRLPKRRLAMFGVFGNRLKAQCDFDRAHPALSSA